MTTEVLEVGRHAKCRRITDRMYAAEQLAVAEEYLAGRLDEDLEDWCTASLVARAVEHFLAHAQKEQDISVELDAAPFGDGLAISITWPDEPAINAVEVHVRIDQDQTISEVLLRGHGARGIRRRVRGRDLATDGTLVMRPVRHAADVSITTRPCHRLDSLAYPHLVGAMEDESAPVERSRTFDYTPPRMRAPSVIDVYREAHGQEDLFELIDMTTALELIRVEKQARAAAFRRKWLRRTVVMLLSLAVVGALTVSTAIVLNRSGRQVPEWMPFVTRLDAERVEVEGGDAADLRDEDSGREAARQSDEVQR